MTYTRRLLLLGLTAFGLVVPVHPAGAQTGPNTDAAPKIDHALTQALRTGAPTQHVIITLKPGYRAAIRQQLQDHGDVIVSEHPSIEALVGELHSRDVTELAQRPEVASIAIDATVYAEGAKVRNNRRIASTADVSETTSTGAVLTTTLRETLGLSRVETGPLTGSSVGVAIIDSGIAPNADFSRRITAFYDLTKGGIKPVAPYDDYGHGTHIAGLLGSSGVQSNGDLQGIAPHVRLVGIKVLDGTGQGLTSDVIRAL